MYTNSNYNCVSNIFNGYVGQCGVQERFIEKVLKAWNNVKVMGHVYGTFFNIK